MVRALKDANFPDEVIRCARSFVCEICAADGNKKVDKPASLPQAHHFNELLEIDVFHLKWNDDKDKKKILAVIDIFSKYEMNALVKRETEDEEIKVLKHRTDASGAHMSEKYISFMDQHNIKLTLVPKETPHRMGKVERLHAVRRLQLLKMRKEEPEIELSLAVQLACSQRNQLRSVHGSSPAQIVFGQNPRQSGLMDEPADLRPDHKEAQQEDHALRYLAARSFIEANTDANLRRALLARPRSEDERFEIGDFVFYWRQGDQKLMVSHWRGPALRLCS